jgi:hypothetical protein
MPLSLNAIPIMAAGTGSACHQQLHQQEMVSGAEYAAAAPLGTLLQTRAWQAQSVHSAAPLRACMCRPAVASLM